jgi:hypothetical protein
LPQANQKSQAQSPKQALGLLGAKKYYIVINRVLNNNNNKKCLSIILWILASLTLLAEEIIHSDFLPSKAAITRMTRKHHDNGSQAV